MSLRTKTQRLRQIVHGWASLNLLAARSVVHGPSLGRFVKVAERAGVYGYKPELPVRGLRELIEPGVRVELQSVPSEPWQVSPSELAAIAALAVSYRPETIFEIGTFDGRTTLNLHLNRPEAKVITLDLPPADQNLPDEKIAGMLIRDRVEAGAIEQLYGNSLAFDFSPYAGQQDFVFIDAGHSYENALSDTRNALWLVEGREGTIVWHDYAGWAGVTQAVQESIATVASPVDACWISGTSLAFMRTRPGEPLRLAK
ncbi:MAG: class I SAM-dependent methyltransferase [Planctomycetota bacterium]